jgi:uncharacterized membrane protein
MLAYLVTGILAWLPGIRYFAWAAPLILFFIEKDSSFVRFHAMQAFILNVIGALLVFIMNVVVYGIFAAGMYTTDYTAWSASLGALGVISIIAGVISIIITVFAIIALVKAYGYNAYKIPLVGNLVDKFAKR